MNPTDASERRREPGLPEWLRPLFWDCRFEQLDWNLHHSFMVGRILESGSWNAVAWLRSRVGDAALRQWIQDRQGGALTPRQLRFWELILGLPHEEVDGWLAQSPRRIWHERLNR